MMQQTFSPGKLVRYRHRRWIVLPSDDREVMLLKPLGGSSQEITGVYLPMQIPGEEVEEDVFPLPGVEDLGDFMTARLLFDAARLSFRNASGPFRCMGKLSFRPRAYQIVPLVMALQQEVTRLMIADDVGVGKTVEALLIIRELLERGEIKSFAVITPPHLCEQWQQELRDKLDLQAEVIRSATAAALDRRLPDDRSIFFHVPYQVISIDYIKADRHKVLFLNDAPDLIVIDEAHTCALPAGAKHKSQQQRYNLLHDLAQDEKRHLLLLTATPHSGKDKEFISLLGLLNPAFNDLDFAAVERRDREKIARYFIQRRRETIRHWLEEETPFPERDAREEKFYLSDAYHHAYSEVLDFARGITRKKGSEQVKRFRYWAALALLRGVMSSPAAGYSMLRNRRNKHLEEEEELLTAGGTENPVFDRLSQDSDFTRAELLDKAALLREENSLLDRLEEQMRSLYGPEKDKKVARAVAIVKGWVKEGFQPIVFCKYIETAKYVGEEMKKALPRHVDVQVVTSEMADEQRREVIEGMASSEKKVLVATDCLSEGINLQDYFTAVLHYDLPWNPNRIAQREGRIDRFGQEAPLIRITMLIGEDNPIDKKLFEVLIKKIMYIQNSTGIYITLGDEDHSLMDEMFRSIIQGDENYRDGKQLAFFVEDFYTQELERIRERAVRLRSIFEHASIKPEMIREDLRAVDEAIGDVKTVEAFVLQAVTHLGATVEDDGTGYILYTRNLPPHLKNLLGGREKMPVSFASPTPPGYRYLGRNHIFVEQLCHFILSLAFDGHPGYQRVARVAEIITDSVGVRTTLVMFRVRNVIKEVRSAHEVVSEEMYLWGYRGSGETTETLTYAEAKELLLLAESRGNLSVERQRDDLQRELARFETLQPRFLELATERAENLVKAHGRFKALVGGRRYEKATPVLPPDVMGVYILMPKPKPVL